jgi:16S rRNA (guanine527-N7)-methyltransferase
MTDDAELHRVLGTLADHGHIGQSIGDALAHSQRFVRALPAGTGAGQLIDLGSGGGIPGLVIARQRPELTVMLVERRRTRADELIRAVRALQLDDRVEVFADDVDALDREVDTVTARSFGAPQETLATACRLLRAGGVALISDPPTVGDHWTTALRLVGAMDDHGATEGIHRFVRR